MFLAVRLPASLGDKRERGRIFEVDVIKVKHKALNGDGKEINPRDAVVPIFKEIGKGKLIVIGTGFYITRYGLFLTAKHVLDELFLEKKKSIGIAYICHRASEDEVHLRRILSVNLLESVDLAMGQADTYEIKYPNDPLANYRCELSMHIPSEGEEVVTYAYPENEVLDFTNDNENPAVHCDFYEGKFLRYLEENERPFIPYPHYETTIQVKSGASGGPVFNRGKVIGVNCRGWDFGDDVEVNEHLSSIVPIKGVLDMVLGHIKVPKVSWEFSQIPKSRDPASLSMIDLVNYGHVLLSD